MGCVWQGLALTVRCLVVVCRQGGSLCCTLQGQRGEGPNSPVRTPSAPPGMLTVIDDTPGLRPIKTSSEEEASGCQPLLLQDVPQQEGKVC